MPWTIGSSVGSWVYGTTDSQADYDKAMALEGSWDAGPSMGMAVFVRQDQVSQLMAAPRVTGISPASGTPTVAVTITGNRFNQATAVRFTPTDTGVRGVEVPAGQWTSASPTRIDCYAVGGIAGLQSGHTYRVEVGNPGGWSTDDVIFTAT
jgi:hypothetical protein